MAASRGLLISLKKRSPRQLLLDGRQTAPYAWGGIPVIRPGAADFTEHPVALLRLQARVGSLLASRPIDRMRGGPPCPRSCRRGSLLAENCGRGGNASEQSFVSLDLDCVLLLISPCMEGLGGANKTAGIYCHHADAIHIGGNRVDGNRALSGGRKISNPNFSPLA